MRSSKRSASTQPNCPEAVADPTRHISPRILTWVILALGLTAFTTGHLSWGFALDPVAGERKTPAKATEDRKANPEPPTRGAVQGAGDHSVSGTGSGLDAEASSPSIAAGEPSPPVLIWSLSNKILELNIQYNKDTGESFLVLDLATDVHATSGSADPTKNITPTCGNGQRVAFRRNAVDPAGLMTQELIRKGALAAKLAPFRAKFHIVQNECVELPDGEATAPLAIGLQVLP